jgi:hypothetical protein
VRDDILIAITTTRRQGADYLPGVIKSLEENGALAVPEEHRLVHSDGSLDGEYPGWQVIETPSLLGSRGSFWNVLRIANEKNLDLLAFEDDIEICKNAVTKMLEVEVLPMLAWVTFFDNVTTNQVQPGLQIRSLFEEPFWGVQAVKIPKWSYPYLLRTDIPVIGIPDGYMGGRDGVMQVYMQQSPFPMYGAFFPNLVQHIGKVSVLNGPRAQKYAALGLERISFNYPGNMFDALTI